MVYCGREEKGGKNPGFKFWKGRGVWAYDLNFLLDKFGFFPIRRFRIFGFLGRAPFFFLFFWLFSHFPLGLGNYSREGVLGVRGVSKEFLKVLELVFLNPNFHWVGEAGKKSRWKSGGFI